MANDSPKRTPQELFAKRIKATSKSLAVLQQRDWLGKFPDLTRDIDQLIAGVDTMKAYNTQHMQAVAELDARIAESNDTTREPLTARKAKLEADAATYYQREATRLARSLKHVSELLMVEYGVEAEKRAHGGTIPEGERELRRDMREGLAETDEFTETPKYKKDDLMRQMDHWGDYVTEYEDRTYQMFQPESSVLWRMKDVPQEYQKPLALMLGMDFLETVSEHAMAFASHVRDEQRRGVSGQGGGGV